MFDEIVGEKKVCIKRKIYKSIFPYIGGVRGVMVIVVGIGHGDTSSNPG